MSGSLGHVSQLVPQGKGSIGREETGRGRRGVSRGQHESVVSWEGRRDARACSGESIAGSDGETKLEKGRI